MYVLIAYDVSTMTPAGKKRLRHVAKACLDYGQRVQNSVFECKVTPAQEADLRSRLMKIMDSRVDSIRIYNLGSNWQRRVEHLGTKCPYDIDGTLIV
ncbi:CRISPR-associated endonuclease Cas2 [Puniceicoccaceae bacterium K14]|nr:CRISPR-associated endonuclease Cas2 [Puniceicoccaceae bacterium K14]